MSSYTVPINLQRVHDWPRFDAAAGLARAGSDFNPDWSSDDGKHYLSAVMSLAAVFFSLGSVLFIGFGIGNCIIARQRAAGQPPLAKRREVPTCCGRVVTWLFEPRIWYIGAVVVMLAGTSTSLAQVQAFQSALTRTISSLDSLNGVLSGTANIVTNSLQPQLTNATSTANAFCADPQTQTLPAALSQQVCALPAVLTGAGAAATSVSSLLSSTVSGFYSQLRSGGTFNLDLLTSRVYYSGLFLLLGFLGWLLASVATLWGSKMCATMFRRCNATLVFLVLQVFLFAGFFLAIGVVGADVCVAPPTAIARIVNLTNTDNIASSTIIFYASCNPSVAYDSTAPGAYGQVAAGQAQVVNASASIDALSAALVAQPWAAAYLTPLSAQVTAINGSMASIAAGVNCATVSPIFSSLLGALCGDGVNAIVIVFALAALAAVLITVMAAAALRLNAAHPGDAAYGYDSVGADRGVFDDELSGEEALIGRSASYNYGGGGAKLYGTRRFR